MNKKLPFLFLVLTLFSFFSCSTIVFKEPRNQNESVFAVILDNQSGKRATFVLLRDGRKKRSTLSPGEREILFFTVKESVQLLPFEREGEVLDLSPDQNTITLYPARLVKTDEGLVREELIPEDKKEVSELLLDHFGFFLWADREAVNFHPYPPRRYGSGSLSVSLETESPAEAWIDGVHWGNTPVEVQLPEGRHQVIYRSGDEELFRTFIDVTGEETFLHSWGAAEIKESDDSFRLVLGPFVHQNQDQFNYIEPLLGGAVSQELAENPRLELLYYEGAGGHSGAEELAREQGAELLLDGFFVIEGENLLIYSRLLDIQSGQVRSSEVFPAELGLDILQAMEDIAVEISNSLDRILPEPGEEFYQVVDSFDESMVEVEQVLAVDYTERVRLEKPNAIYGGLSLGLNFATIVSDTLDAATTPSFLMMNLQAEHFLSRNLSLRLSYYYSNSLFGYDETLGDFLLDSHRFVGSLMFSSSGSEQNVQFAGVGLSYETVEGQTDPLSYNVISAQVLLGSRIYTSPVISGKKRFWDFSFDIPFFLLGMSDYGEVQPINLINFHMAWGGKF